MEREGELEGEEKKREREEEERGGEKRTLE